MIRTKICLTVMLLLVCSALFAQENLSEHLAPLKPFIGKTWVGTFNNSSDGKQTIDVSRWERALNGQAVRILHSINNGEYGGESILYWDKEKKSIVYYYFTTAGFMTHGTMSFNGNKIISRETVSGNENGITEVKSVGEVLPDGTMRSTSQYLQNGKWVEGHSATYKESPDAKVIFK